MCLDSTHHLLNVSLLIVSSFYILLIFSPIFSSLIFLSFILFLYILFFSPLFLLFFFKFQHWLSCLNFFRISSSFKIFRHPPLFSHHYRALEILYYLNFGRHLSSFEILQCPIALDFLPSILLMHCMLLIVILLFCMMVIVYAYFLGCQNWTWRQAIV